MDEEDDVDFDFDGNITRADFCEDIHDQLKEQSELLHNVLESNGSHSQVFRELFHFIRPIAFKLILDVPDKSRLDIPVDIDNLLRPFLYELTIVLLDDINPLDKLHKLQEQESPTEICGRIFRVGDFTYSCRDCGADGTCVMCSDCFNRSQHVNHNYKMCQSGGGGTCDCGDPEAWKRDYVCSHHAKANTDEERMLTPEEQRLQARAKSLFSALICFAFELIYPDLEVFDEGNRYQSRHLLSEVLKTEEFSRFSLMLYNDEIHTYDQVEKMLTQSVQANAQQAQGYAATVDKSGRTILRQTSRAECVKIQKEVSHLTKDETSFQRDRQLKTGPIKTLIIDSRLVGMQEMAIGLMQWMNWIASELEIFRKSFCTASMETKWANIATNETDKPLWAWSENGNLSSLEVMLLSDIHTWKSVRQVVLKIMLELFLKDYDNKLLLARQFAKHYKQIYINVENDDHDYKYSSSSITVQLFTVPTVTRYLIEQHDIINVITETLFVRYFPYNDKGERELRNISRGYRNATMAVTDFEYVLGNIPSTAEEFAPMKEPFISGLSWFLEMLRLFQGKEGIIWSPRNHVEQEPEWENAVTFVMYITPIYKKVFAWASLDDKILEHCITHIAMLLAKRPRKSLPLHNEEDVVNHPYEIPSTNDVLVWGLNYSILNIDINCFKVSVYCPLSRILTSALGRISTEGASKLNLTRHEITFYCTDSLVALCLAAQVRAGLWRRNGQATMYIIHYYSHVRCRELMSNLDHKALQIMAAHMPPNHFLATLINTIGLNHGYLSEDFKFSSDEFKNSSKAVAGQRANYTRFTKETDYMEKLHGEFLLLIIRVINEKWCDMSSMDRRSEVRRFLIHQLAMDYSPWSKVLKQLKYMKWDGADIAVAEEMLKELTDTRDIKGVKQYGLKKKYIAEWDRYYVNYDNADQSRAFEAVSMMVRSDPEDIKLSISLAKVNHEFTPRFQPVVDLLDSDLMRQIIIKSLQQRPTQSVVDKCVYLISLAILHGRSKWIIEDNLLDILTTVSENFDVNALKWIKQKLDMTDTDDSAKRTHDQNDRKRRAMAMRQRLMDKMRNLQNIVMSQNPDYFASDKTMTSFENAALVIPSSDSEDSADDDFKMAPEPPELHVTPEDTDKINLIDDQWTCILCQEDKQVSIHDENPLVMLGFIEQSTVLNRFNTVEIDSPLEDNEIFANFSHDIQPIHATTGTHISTCGHVMHHSCFLENRKKERDRERRYPNIGNNMHRGAWKSDNEFSCMLCSRLCNTLLPLIERQRHHQNRFQPCRSSKTNVDDISTFPKTLPLWQWIRQCEDELAPAPRHEPKTYVINMGTIDMSDAKPVNDHLMDVDSDDENQTLSPLDLTQDANEELKLIDGFATQTDGDTASNEDNYDRREDSDLRNLKIYEILRDFYGKFSEDGDYIMNLQHINAGPIWKTAAYTLQAAETLLRLDKKPLLGALSVRKDKAIEMAIRASICEADLGADINDDPDHIKKDNRMIARKLLSCLFPHSKNTFDVPPILACDLFQFYFRGAIVFKFLDDIKPLYHQKQNEKHVLRLLTAAHITQIAIFTPISDIEKGVHEVDNRDDDEMELFMSLINQLRMGASLAPFDVKASELYYHFQKCMKPFLSCVAMLLSYLNLLTPPPELSDGETTWSLLCLALGLPDRLCSLFDADGSSLEPQAQKWIQKLMTDKDKYKLNISHLSFPKLVKIPTLITLPSDYRTVIEMTTNFRCKQRRMMMDSMPDSSSSPAMCLICGHIICTLSKCCQKTKGHPLNDQQGEFGGGNNHVLTCGKGTGLFMLIRSNEPLYRYEHYPKLYEACSGIMISARQKHAATSFNLPYLDVHGEPDRGLQQGSQLLFSAKNYALIQRLWLCHEITETVSRDVENSRGGHDLSHWDMF